MTGLELSADSQVALTSAPSQHAASTVRPEIDIEG